MPHKPRKKPDRRTAKPVVGPEQTLTIDRLDDSGFGRSGDARLPFALPGEVVCAQKIDQIYRATSFAQQSDQRQPFACPHFGWPGDGCGGCVVQHVGLASSLDWKVQRLVRTLERVLGSVPAPTVFQSAPRSRRRARFAVLRQGGRWIAGYHALRSHEVVSISACAVIHPHIEITLHALLTAMNSASGDFGGANAVHLTCADNGIDVDIQGCAADNFDIDRHERMSALAERLDLARLSFDGVPHTVRRHPVIAIDGVPTALPIAPFLQATADGEAALQAHVLSAVGGAEQFADLFCGIGTFSLPVSRGRAVYAADGSKDAVDALSDAARRGRRPITTEVRDLFRRPLQPQELQKFGAVVFDPPRAGAADQVAALVASSVPVVVAVSCDPLTLARDAASLAATYDLVSLHLVDQFIWSAHIETVAVFHRRTVGERGVP